MENQFRVEVEILQHPISYEIKTSLKWLFMILRNQMFLIQTYRYRNEGGMCLRQSN